MATTLNLDPQQIQQVDGLLQQDYQEAFSRGLNLASRPDSDTDNWEAARTQLSAEAYNQIKPLLNSAQQPLFDRMFMTDFMFKLKVLKFAGQPTS
jgi:hypothetical protein